MYTWFLCILVLALSCSNINAAHVTENNGYVVYRQVLDTPIRNVTLNETCKCQAARNEYTYRYPEVVRMQNDPVYHYQKLANNSYTWNCGMCAVQPIYHYMPKCQCAEAMERYVSDYKNAGYTGGVDGAYGFYESTGILFGHTWHCELCILSPNLTCIDARLRYFLNYRDQVQKMDEVFHYITYGYWQGLLWPTQFCPRDVSSGNDITELVCPRAVFLYSLFYNGDTWGIPAADHYRRYHLMIGRPWYYYSCDQITPLPEYSIILDCQCLHANTQYYTNYQDILTLGVNGNFHFKYIAYKEPFRKWDCDLCNTTKYPGDSVNQFFDTVCKCEKAVGLFIARYKSMFPAMDNSTAWNIYIAFKEDYGLIWNCESCPNTTRQSILKLEPRHLLKDTTCIAARNAYMTKYPEVVTNKQDPVWHFENYGYKQAYFWDQGLCQSAFNPKYPTEFPCSTCEAAKLNYSMSYVIASTFYDPWEHWRLFYLRNTKTGEGYVYNCEGLCDLNALPTTQATTTGTTTTGGTTSTGSTTGGTTSTGSPTVVPNTISSTIGNPNTGASSQSDGMNRSSSDNNDDSGLDMGPLLAIVVPIAAVLSVGIGMLFIHQQRRQAVQALVKAEEGERRNYKIDFMSLSIDWLIGSGSFGHVYRGEYRGADVAIKKLKKQNMGNQQLEDLAKEAMVMVGLRHPNIVLFMGVCLERPELCIVTEYMPRGNLYDVLHDSVIKLPFSVVKNMALHVVKGLQFIHSAGMIHRDLKSPNLLVDANWTIKIADFGLSCAKSQITDDAQISLLWTSPEILMREKNCYSEKSDVYSLGIILWELMSRQTPFNEFTAAAIPPVIVLGKRPPVNSDWNPTLKVLMAQCWGQLPSHRPSVREVRGTLESIQHDSSLSEAGANTPASVHSSISSDMGSEVSVFPPRGHITVAFIDVDNSGKLWEADPSTMLVALRLLNDTNRKMLIEYGGYEAKTEGDASMLTFSDPVNAVNYCIATQLALLEVDWPPSLLKHPAAKEEWSEQGILLYRGLRVRMGLHIGVPHCEQDQITFRTEYFGPIVNTAARIVSQAVGGQIVASTDVYKLIANNLTKLESCAIEQSGSIVAKNSEPMNLYQIWPKELKERDSHPIVDLTNNNNSLTNSPHYSSDNYGYSQDSMDSNDSYEEDRYAWNLRHNEKWIIDYDDLDLDVVIGTGSFGDVFSGTLKGNKVAIKQFMKQKITDEILLEMRTESGILSAIEHPNIIKFIGMCIKIPHLCLVTELLERGSLAAILLGSEPLSWEQRKNFALDIAKGLQYLHSNNIIHRDVKSPNMLVAADWTIKIGDFGFSRVKSESHTMTQCGTVAWTAPEIFLGERYSEKADVYSYAVILWELVFRKKPWQGMNSMKVCHSVENGERLSTANPPTGTPEFMIKLMDACWLQDHEARPSFTEVIKFIEQQQQR